jgi:phospholipid/cholesterol/gamma-HCH transport system substrate-binding protein
MLLSGGSKYVLHARFLNAGQLVPGDLVTVAGHQVGSVGKISLSPNGLADVELDISDHSITPVRAATVATIGQLSLTGVANRFVGLSLGPGAPIDNGGTLSSTQTRGIVDLDTVLDALNPSVRAALRRILQTGARFVSAPTASQLHRALPFANPALSQINQLGSKLVADQFAFERLLSSTAKVTTALAARSRALGGAVSSTAYVLRQVASERSALADSLLRAPGVLTQGTGVLADANYTLRLLDPVLADVRPVAPRVAALLRAVVPAASGAVPTIRGLQSLVAPAEAALKRLPPVAKLAVPAINSLTTALRGLTPILSGFRPYIPDAIAGFFNAFGGSDGQSYDANGHYIRIPPELTGSGPALTGILRLLGDVTQQLNPLTGQRTGLLARCPGGGGPPAPDGSNPWTSPDVLAGIGTLCNPADDLK